MSSNDQRHSAVVNSDSDKNKNNKIANLPYPALKNIFWYAATNPARSLSTFGSVCDHWRSILQVTGSIWDRFVLQRWPHTPQENRTYETFIARHQKIHETLRPIKARDTTAIEDCDLPLSKCPLLLENLDLADPVFQAGPGLAFHCNVCNKNVFIVRNEAEKLLHCTEDRKERVVIYEKPTTHPSSSVRIRVALVTKDETEEQRLAAPAKVKKALNEIRMAADLENYPSSISTNDRLIVEFKRKRAVAEFRHVPQSELIDSSTPDYKSASTVINPKTGKKERPYLADVVLFIDDETYPANFNVSAVAIAIRLGETSMSIATNSHSPHPPHGAEAVVNEAGNLTTDLDLFYNIEDNEWVFGDSRTQYVMGRYGPQFGFRDFTQFLVMADDTPRYSATTGGCANQQTQLEEYLLSHPEMDLRMRTKGSAGIFIATTLVAPDLPDKNDIKNDDDDDEREIKSSNRKSLQRYPVFEVYDANDNLLQRVNFFHLARLVFCKARDQARDYDARIAKFFQGYETDSQNYLVKLPVCICLPITSSIFGVTSTVDALYRQDYDARLKEILASCGLDVQCVKKESSMATLSMKNWDVETQEIFALQIRCGGRSSCVEEFSIEDGIIDHKAWHEFSDFGGERLDTILAHWVLGNHVQDSKLRQVIRNTHRPFFRLTKACMRARHRLSSTLETHLEIDYIVDDFDIAIKLSRAKMEDILRPEFENFINNLLKKVTFRPEKVTEIVLTAGLCNTPRLIFLLERAFPNVEKILNLKSNTSKSIKISSVATASSGNKSQDYIAKESDDDEQQHQNQQQQQQQQQQSSSSSDLYRRTLIQHNPSTAGACSTLIFALKRKIGSLNSPTPKVMKAPYSTGFATLSAVNKALDTDMNAFVMLDVTPLSISAGDASTGISQVIVQRHTTMPLRKHTTMLGRHLFSAVIDPATGAKTSEVRIFEGERAKFADNHLVVSIMLPQEVHHESTITIECDINPDGVFTVNVRDSLNDQNTARAVVANGVCSLSSEELDNMHRQAFAFEHEDALLREKVSIKKKIETKVMLIKKFVEDEGSLTKLTKEQIDSLKTLYQDAMDYCLNFDTTKLDETFLQQLEDYFTTLENRVIQVMMDAGFEEETAQAATSPPPSRSNPSWTQLLLDSVAECEPSAAESVPRSSAVEEID